MKLQIIVFIGIVISFSCDTNENKTHFNERDITSKDSLKNNKTVSLTFQKLYKEDYLQEVLKKGHHNYQPIEGVIPDSITAIKIAEIILSNIYTEEQINEEKPFTALLQNGYWIVFGYLPEGYAGGVAEIVIRKDNGEIINISHSK